MPVEAVPRLEVKTTGISRVPSLEVKTEHVVAVSAPQSVRAPGLQVQSQGVTIVSSLLQVKSEGVTNLPTLPGGGADVGAIVEMPGLEIKTEAVSTSGLVVTSPVERRSPDTGLSSPASGGAGVSTPGGLVGMTVTGSGSVTATPTVYTTAVTTTATTTTTPTGQEGASSLLGKRIRRQSTKYEDYEQQTLTVSWLLPVSLAGCSPVCLCGRPSSIGTMRVELLWFVAQLCGATMKLNVIVWRGVE